MFALARKALFSLPAETAHTLTIKALKAGLVPAQSIKDNPKLHCQLAGLDLKNPLGLAAGFDKGAEVPLAMLQIGFGMTEVGTITPRPQKGNPKPRIFRLKEDEAIINRLGFNNAGMEAASKHLSKLPEPDKRKGPIGVNIGPNKDSKDRLDDYRQCAQSLGASADYLVINISSPNTPGLRTLQNALELEKTVAATQKGLEERGATPPVFVKVAPDLSREEISEISKALKNTAASGLIVSNTTLSRPKTLKSIEKNEAGGLSGAPLFPLATNTLKQFFTELDGQYPIIGVGGINSAESAYAKIRAGASAIQLYSALIYKGPGLVKAVLDGLDNHLSEDGFSSIQEAVGKDA